jgi:ABC-2 type transport system permease protein
LLNRVFWIVLKNFQVLVADWKGLFFAYLLPVALASITGLAFSGVGGGGGTSKLDVGYVDLDSSEPVKQLVKSLAASDSLVLESVKDPEAARNLVLKREKLAVIVFPEGSGEKLSNGLFSPEKAELTLIIDPSRQVERGMLQGILMREVMKALSSDMMNPDRVMGRMKRGLAAIEADESMETGERNRWGDFMRAGVDMFEKLKEANEGEGDEVGGGSSAFAPDFSEPFKLNVDEVSGKKGEKHNMYAQTYSGTGVMFLLFGVMGAAINLVQERQRGTLKRVLTAPVSRIEILAGEGIYYFLFSMSQLLVLFAAAKLLFDIPFHGSTAGFLLIISATGAAVTGFGLLIAAFGQTERQVSGIAVLVILVMSCLGGSWFPVWLMPEFMQIAASVTINKWAVLGFEGATWRGLGFMSIFWPNCVVLFGMAALFFGIAAWRFRWD